MNKIVIPAILGTIVMIAAVFALMPVEKATTTHIGTINKVNTLICASDVDAGGDTVYNPTTNRCEAPPEG